MFMLRKTHDDKISAIDFSLRCRNSQIAAQGRTITRLQVHIIDLERKLSHVNMGRDATTGRFTSPK